MRAHEQYRRLLARRTELAPPDEARVQRHLLSCEDCRRLAADYDAEDALLRPLAQTCPQPGLREEVLAAIDRPTGPVHIDTRPAWMRTALAAGLAVVILIAGGAGAVSWLGHHPAQSLQVALAQKGYQFLSASERARIRSIDAERMALAFFPGKVTSVQLVKVKNTSAPVFGERGRLCWMVSISPAGGPQLTQPGSDWLDSGSTQATNLVQPSTLVVFVDA